MAHDATDHGKPEGLASGPRAASQSKLPLPQSGPHDPHSATLRGYASDDTVGPPVRLTFEDHGDCCSTSASLESSFSWPVISLSPAKTQEAGTDLYAQLSSRNVRPQHQRLDSEKNVKFTGGCSLAAGDHSATCADCSPLQCQHQQHELQTQIHRPCGESRRHAADPHSQQGPFRGSEIGWCLERPAECIDWYGRSLFRVVVEKGRRTLQRRRMDNRRLVIATSSKNEPKGIETPIRFPVRRVCVVKGFSCLERVDDVHPLPVNKEGQCGLLGSPDAYKCSSRTANLTVVDTTQLLSHKNCGLVACSAVRCDTFESVCTVDFPSQNLQRGALKRKSAEVQDSSALWNFGVEDLRSRPSNTSSIEAQMEELRIASPGRLQVTRFCLPEQDPPELLPRKSLSQTAAMLPDGEISWRQETNDHPCLPRRNTFHTMSSIPARAKLTSTRLSSAETEAEEEATKADSTTPNMERVCSTLSPLAASHISEDPHWTSTSCRHGMVLFDCVPKETNYVPLDNQNLRIPHKCIFAAGDGLLDCTNLHQNSHLLGSRALIGSTRSVICTRRRRYVPCLWCSQDGGEMWYAQSRNYRLLHSSRSARAVNRASTSCPSSRHLWRRNILQAFHHIARPVPAFFWKAASCACRGFSGAPLERYKGQLSSLVPTSPAAAHGSTTVPHGRTVGRSSDEAPLREGDAEALQNMQSALLHGDATSIVTKEAQNEHAGTNSLNACNSEPSGSVHDTSVMKWISKERLLDSIADALTALVARSDSMHKEEACLPPEFMRCVLLRWARNVEGCTWGKRNRKFDGIRCPAITVRDYYYRIAALCSCSYSCHLLALIYVDRLRQSVRNLFVDMLNIHRILITSIMCAAKFYDDTFLSNAYYAMVGGVSLREMNRLEVRFLSMINFRLTVLPEHFGVYLTRLGCIGPQRLNIYIEAHARSDEETATPTATLS